MKEDANSPRHASLSGFSLFELVIILVMMGIIGMVMMPVFVKGNDITTDVQAKTFAANLRRAQLLAMTHRMNLYVCTTLVSYSIQPNASCSGNAIPDPAGGPFSVTLEKGVQLGGSSLGAIWSYNSAGTPSSGASYSINSPGHTGGNNSQPFVVITVQVAPLTGNVSVSQ